MAFVLFLLMALVEKIATPLGNRKEPRDWVKRGSRFCPVSGECAGQLLREDGRPATEVMLRAAWERAAKRHQPRRAFFYPSAKDSSFTNDICS